MVSAWLRSGRIQAMPSGTSCKAFSQWSFPWIRRLRRECVSNGDHGFLVKEHVTPGFMKSGVHVFLVRREMFSEPPALILNRYQEKCYASGLTLEHVRWHYNDYTIQKKLQKNLHLSRKLLHWPWYVYRRYQFMCSVIVIEFPNVPLVHPGELYVEQLRWCKGPCFCTITHRIQVSYKC
jgi:hypothetical protein